MASEAILSAEASACRAIAELAEHCTFAATALPANEETVRWLAKQFAEIMDMAREGIDLPAKNWHKEPTDA
jgi:hypothetical protein